MKLINIRNYLILSISIILCLFEGDVVSARSTTLREVSKHSLLIDNVLELQHIDRATLSPDGEWVAVVIQRGALTDEVYGRTAYEVDPSRNDVWLISIKTGERRSITNGKPMAAGYWCATWSPDGKRLAFLSTQPEHDEPRGGDNVRLYIWDRVTGTVARASDDALMTQTRYGSALYKLDLRSGTKGDEAPHTCNDREENAPFLWLGNDRLLMATLPRGSVTGLIDQYGRSFREAALDAVRLHDGREPTARAVGSGNAQITSDEMTNAAILKTLNVSTGVKQIIATVPAYPFRGGLTLSVSPDGGKIAVLATVGALQPEAGRTFPNTFDDSWTVERRLGFIDLTSVTSIHWKPLPSAARFPLELFGWSPDSRFVALRAREDRFAQAAALFIVASQSGMTTRLGPGPVSGDQVRSTADQEIPVLWADGRRLLARLQDVGPRKESHWWLLDINGEATNLKTPNDGLLSAFRSTGSNQLVGVLKNDLVRLDLTGRALLPVSRLRGHATIISSGRLTPCDTASILMAVDTPDGKVAVKRVSLTTGMVGPPLKISASSTILDADACRGKLLTSDSGREGLFLREVNLTSRSHRELLALDTELATVNWGETKIIDYLGTDGKPLKAAMILPPNYQPGHRYPTLIWAYQGYRVHGLEGEYWLDPLLPGIYNLQLYAAQGYVVLIPSMPLPPVVNRDFVYGEMTQGLMPAIDKLVALGIADPDRLGVMGQSRGGYSVYALVAQTNRFKGAVAMAGITDLAGYYGQFDPTARGYPGIEHEKSDNWAEVDQFGLFASPGAASDGYSRNSPLTYVDSVTTPLLMIHGEFDTRGTSTQAEQFFFALYQRGRTAKLIRYGGESHSLAQSPANIRDIYTQTINWFDRYVKNIDPIKQPAR